MISLPTNQHASWSPILLGEEREQAIEAVFSVARDLPSPMAEMSPSLYSGSAGFAVFFSYLEMFDPGRGHRERALQYLEHSWESLSRHYHLPNLFGGLAGIAWAVNHVGRILGEDWNEDLNSQIDSLLLEHLRKRSSQDEFDLIGGLTGIGVYALSRLDQPLGADLLEAVVDLLREAAVLRPEGAAWLTSPRLLPEWKREQTPFGRYELGLAHGSPGVIGLLAGACAAGVAVTIARPLLDSAVNWLVSQANPLGSEARFDTTLSADEALEPRPPKFRGSRVAWCYGDPGVAIALWAAARAVGEPRWEEFAINIAKGAALRPVKDPVCRDGGLCHGATGAGHLFNRFYQGTGESCFKDSARGWFKEALNTHRDSGFGIGGFWSWGGEKGKMLDSGLLEGSVGIALSLLSSATDIVPAWDSFMMASLSIS